MTPLAIKYYPTKEFVLGNDGENGRYVPQFKLSNVIENRYKRRTSA